MRSQKKPSDQNRSNNELARQPVAIGDPHQLSTIAAGFGLALATSAINAEEDRQQGAQAFAEDSQLHSSGPAEPAAVNAGPSAFPSAAATATYAQQSSVPAALSHDAPAASLALLHDGADQDASLPFASEPATSQSANHGADSAEMPHPADASSLQNDAASAPGLDSFLSLPQPIALHNFDLSQLQLDLANMAGNALTPALSNLAETVAGVGETIAHALDPVLDTISATASAAFTEVIPTHLAGEALASLDPLPLTLGFLGQSYAELIDLHDVSSVPTTPLHGLI